eukprot:TRINITY_DN81904_c0_g1_i1.p1 TRINITY_DN81904_c0_g1~~TRINITY_DN81904_c0_g1_i1.p1  ORF type:complete len:669 (+),score=213.06 TRINITY_DN81904_c0_g1_i1:198-2204(+)
MWLCWLALIPAAFVGAARVDDDEAAADPAVSPAAGEEDPCRCMEQWLYLKDHVTYAGCVETPDWPGHTWCYVKGGASCPTAKDSLVAGETRKFRECQAPPTPENIAKEEAAAGKMVPKPGRGPGYTSKKGTKPDLKAAQNILKAGAIAEAEDLPAQRKLTMSKAMHKDELQKRIVKAAQEVLADACRCMDEWTHGPDKKPYQGCAETADWPGHTWCYVQGGPVCTSALPSREPNDPRRFKECKAKQENDVLPHLIADKVINGDKQAEPVIEPEEDDTLDPRLAEARKVGRAMAKKLWMAKHKATTTTRPPVTTVDPRVIAARVVAKKVATKLLKQRQDEAMLPDLPLPKNPDGSTNFDNGMNQFTTGMQHARASQLAAMKAEELSAEDIRNLEIKALQAQAQERQQKVGVTKQQKMSAETRKKADAEEKLNEADSEKEVEAFRKGDVKKELELRDGRLRRNGKIEEANLDALDKNNIAAGRALAALREHYRASASKEAAAEKEHKISQEEQRRHHEETLERTYMKNFKKASKLWVANVKKDATAAAAHAGAAVADMREAAAEQKAWEIVSGRASELAGKAKGAKVVGKAVATKGYAQRQLAELSTRMRKDSGLIKESRDLQTEAKQVIGKVQLMNKHEAQAQAQAAADKSDSMRHRLALEKDAADIDR